MSVRDWPTYLLRDIPEGTRAALEEDAAREERSMIEILRELLCSYYELDCPPVTATARPPKPSPGTGTMLLRLQPELWEALKSEASESDRAYGAMDKIIHRVLAEHYSEALNGK